MPDIAKLNKRLKFRHPSITPHNWEQNSKHQFAAFFAQEIYSSNSLYTHIPKNASSTMRYSVALANGLIDEVTDISWVYANNMTFFPTLRSQVLADYAFVILRCPFSRLASAFLDQLVRRPHMYLIRQRKKGYIKDILDKIFAPIISFERFVFKLLDKANFLRLNAHWAPQVDFLLFQEYDDYFCVEEMDMAVKTLKDKIDFDVIDTRPLSRHGIDSYQKVAIENGFKVTATEISRMKASDMVVDPRSLYSEVLIDMVRQIYSDDINLYVSKFGSKNLLFPI